MKIGFLICGKMSDASVAAHGDYSDLYEEFLGGQGFTHQSWDIEAGEIPTSPDDADGWLISGSKHSAFDDLPWIPALEDFIRNCVTNARPVVGICFGHQILAQALGGKVERFSGGWTIGRQTYDFGGLQTPLMAWHQDQVTQLAPGAMPIASSSTCENAAIAYGDRALGLQAHPEFDAEAVEIIAQVNLGNVPGDTIDAAMQDLDGPLANEMLADQVADFFRLPRQG